MRSLLSSLIICLVTCVTISSTMACSCFNPQQLPYCHAPQSDNELVALGVVLHITSVDYLDSMSFEVLEEISGTMDSTVVGIISSGAACGEDLYRFNVGDTLVLRLIADYGPNEDYFLGGQCYTHFLRYRNDTLLDVASPISGYMPYELFRASGGNCAMTDEAIYAAKAPFFKIGSSWTYDYTTADAFSITRSSITYTLVDTFRMNGLLTDRIVSTQGDTVLMQQDLGDIYIYDEYLDRFVLSYRFREKDRYPFPFLDEGQEKEALVTVDQMDIYATANENLYLQHLSIEETISGDLLDYPRQYQVLDRVGIISRPMSGGDPLSLWINRPSQQSAGITGWGRLRCYESPDRTLHLLPPNSVEPCDTTVTILLQDLVYDMVEPDRTWHVRVDHDPSDFLIATTRIYRLATSPTRIDGQDYLQLFYTDRRHSDDEEPTDRYLRQEGAQVYLWRDGAEGLLYDFDQEVGDLLLRPFDDYPGPDSLTVYAVDTVMDASDNMLRKRQTYHAIVDGQVSESPCLSVLSGVGSSTGLAFNDLWDCRYEEPEALLCMHTSSSTWINDNYYSATFDCWVYLTDIIEQPTAKDIRLYPNPSRDQVFLSTSKTTDYRIVNASGMVLEAGQVTPGQAIDISHLADGVYMFQLLGDEATTMRLVKY